MSKTTSLTELCASKFMRDLAESGDEMAQIAVAIATRGPDEPMPECYNFCPDCGVWLGAEEEIARLRAGIREAIDNGEDAGSIVGDMEELLK